MSISLLRLFASTVAYLIGGLILMKVTGSWWSVLAVFMFVWGHCLERRHCD